MILANSPLSGAFPAEWCAIAHHSTHNAPLKGGQSINLAGTGDTSTVTLAAEFTGAMIVGPISAAVEKNATAELETSLARLRDLAA
jgi:hypothetical protein